ncbi:hypothetical protein [Fuerstiella marisgermanici]|uniref:hypothetical protein n=1 Tax=Fuerstiella marisgermanici TaxID=1891926 RepID=UPI001313FEB1|nr:hypothetical protein [Fuerstiella marisgermanici]
MHGIEIFSISNCHILEPVHSSQPPTGRRDLHLQIIDDPHFRKTTEDTVLDIVAAIM